MGLEVSGTKSRERSPWADDALMTDLCEGAVEVLQGAALRC
jgi:hypothetical protein